MKFNLQFSIWLAFFNEAFALANTCDHDVGYNPILGTSTYLEGSSCIPEYTGMQACSCNGDDIVRLQIPRPVRLC
jgi:NO-binding membrane sensor protein with MHYT domain